MARRQPVHESKPAPGAAHRRGRLSKEEIVLATLELLRTEPHEPITLERVAAAVGASQMSLYVHVGSREGLLDAVAEHALGNFRIEFDHDAPWQERLYAWVEGVLRVVRECPAPLLLLGRPNSPALVGWATMLAELVRCLEGTGLAGLDLANVVRWVGRSTTSLAVMEATYPNPSGLFSILERLESADQAGVSLLLPLLPDLADTNPLSASRFAAERTVAAIEALLEQRHSNEPQSRNGRRPSSNAPVQRGSREARKRRSVLEDSATPVR